MTMVKIAMHIEARSFEISKLRNLLKNPWDRLNSVKFVINYIAPTSEPSLNTRRQNVALQRSQSTKFSVLFPYFLFFWLITLESRCNAIKRFIPVSKRSTIVKKLHLSLQKASFEKFDKVLNMPMFSKS